MGAKIKNNAPMRRLFIGRSFTAHKYKVTITHNCKKPVKKLAKSVTPIPSN